MPVNKSLPEGADSSVLNLYEKREKIYARSIEGFYQKIRLFTGWPLLVAYFGCPWLLWGGRQSILFDLPERKFHIFFLTFWPQDFSLLAWALVIAAFLLFFIMIVTVDINIMQNLLYTNEVTASSIARSNDI